MTPKCIACGMPMETAEDHAGADAARDYCRHCAQPDGSMQSYEDKLKSLTQFAVRTQGMDETAARGAVKTMMSQLPAWKNRTEA